MGFRGNQSWVWVWFRMQGGLHVIYFEYNSNTVIWPCIPHCQFMLTIDVRRPGGGFCKWSLTSRHGDAAEFHNTSC